MMLGVGLAVLPGAKGRRSRVVDLSAGNVIRLGSGVLFALLGLAVLALRDRRLTRDEQVKLARLAEELGIGAGEAMTVLRDAERERVADDGTREAAA